MEYTNNIYLYFIITLLFILVLLVLIKNVKYKKSNNNVKLDMKEVPEEKEFILICPKIEKDKNYYIALNNVSNELYLTKNSNLACKFIIYNTVGNTLVDEELQHKLICLKCMDNEKYLNYNYPEFYNSRYNITAKEHSISNNTLLKFNFNIKNKGFTIKFDNGHNLVYDNDTKMLYSSKDFINNKKLIVLIETV